MKGNLNDKGQQHQRLFSGIDCIFTGEAAGGNLFVAVEVNEPELLDSTFLEAN